MAAGFWIFGSTPIAKNKSAFPSAQGQLELAGLRSDGTNGQWPGIAKIRATAEAPVQTTQLARRDRPDGFLAFA
jgi:hypothetical protein